MSEPKRKDLELLREIDPTAAPEDWTPEALYLQLRQREERRQQGELLKENADRVLRVEPTEG